MSIEGTAKTEYASLSGKIHTFVVDKTLSISGACADAKETGDRLEEATRSAEEAQEIFEEAVSNMDAAAEESARRAVSKLTAGDVGAYSKEETDEAFQKVDNRLNLMTDGVAEITVTVNDETGSPVSNVQVTGIFADDGSAVYTNESGVASGYISEGERTISIDYADLSEVSETFTVLRGNTLTKTLTPTRRNFLKLTASKTLRFSDNVTRVDVTAVGGGGGGGNANVDRVDNAVGRGAGGGGGYCTVTENVPFVAEEKYPAVVGAGAPASSAVGSYGKGKGGTSSFLGVEALGGDSGEAGSPSASSSAARHGDAGVGNGNGADQNYAAVAGAVAGYSSFTETVAYGGGGGAQGDNWDGAGYGGDGFHLDGDYKNVESTPGQDGFGGGGGAGGHYIDDGEYEVTKGAAGGCGCIAIRMHLKTA